MNQLLEWLSGGDLRSDGMANEAADFVLAHPELLGELLAGLDQPEDLIRGRPAGRNPRQAVVQSACRALA